MKKDVSNVKIVDLANVDKFESKFCVYIHLEADTFKPFYVGIGNTRRPYRTTQRSQFWHNVTKKHGFVVDIICDRLTWCDATEWEILFVRHYGRRNNSTGILVNQTKGGDGRIGCDPWNKGIPCTEQRRKNISKAKLGKTMSEIAKSNMKGRTPWNKGLTKETDSRVNVSIFTREKMSKAHTGTFQAEETIRKRLRTKIKKGTILKINKLEYLT